MIEVCRELIDRNIKSIFTNDIFKTYLDFVSNFLSLPYENQVLLFCQNPDITKVSSFYGWNKLNRKVKENAEALYIIFPTYREKKMFLTVGYIFDESQTEGEEIYLEPPKCDFLNLIREYAGLIVYTKDTSKNEYEIDYSEGNLYIPEYTEDINVNSLYLQAFVDFVCDTEIINYPECENYILYINQMIKYVLLKKVGFSINKYSFPYINKLGKDLDEYQLKFILNMVQFFSNSIWENLVGNYLNFYETAVLNSIYPLPDTKADLVMKLEELKDSVSDVCLINATVSLYNKIMNISLEKYQEYFNSKDFVLSYPCFKLS